MAESSNIYGQICWFEVPVMSVSRASAFYSSVLGWECNDQEGKPSPTGLEKSIHMFNKGMLHGAFLLLPDDDATAKVANQSPPKKSVPVATFMVESIEETIKKVEAAGGKVNMSVKSSASSARWTLFLVFMLTSTSPKTEIGGGMGVFARFIDTEGNLQGIWAKE